MRLLGNPSTPIMSPRLMMLWICANVDSVSVCALLCVRADTLLSSARGMRDLQTSTSQIVACGRQAKQATRHSREHVRFVGHDLNRRSFTLEFVEDELCTGFPGRLDAASHTGRHRARVPSKDGWADTQLNGAVWTSGACNPGLGLLASMTID